jgi:hypothetical protein
VPALAELKSALEGDTEALEALDGLVTCSDDELEECEAEAEPALAGETSVGPGAAGGAPADAESFRERGYSASYGQTFGRGPYTGRPGRGRYSGQPVRSGAAPIKYDADIEDFRNRRY